MTKFRINLHMEFDMETPDGWSKDDAIASFFEELSYPELASFEYNIVKIGDKDEETELRGAVSPR